MPTVYFVKQNQSLHCPAGANLRRIAIEHGIGLQVFPNNLINCFGNGLCGTCRVKVDDLRAVSERTPAEEAKLGWEGPEYRLACQTRVLADVSVVSNPRRKLAWTNHPTYQWMQKME
ncbi:MAG: (2Fe-2S)-binding protein [Deltaproteobacteria bacterium]|nr:(2Fe-2S)-binding protein [Deltaproteobacteria bacterium]